MIFLIKCQIGLGKMFYSNKLQDSIKINQIEQQF